jgi:transcriptional/translational regulatory protein YebC/TACO1
LAAEFSEVTRIAQTEVELDSDTARGALKLLEMLDDHDDVQDVSTNLKLSPELMAELNG